MKRLVLGTALLLPVALNVIVTAQMPDHAGMPMKKSVASTELLVTGIAGTTRTLTTADVKALPHVTVTVHNAHSNKDESYSGVPVKELLGMVEPASGAVPRASTNMTAVIAGATDDFHVVLAFCDINPDCRTGQAIVADMQDGATLTKDGAFKLILTEDKKPGRWVRNLSSLTVKNVAP